MSFKVDQHKQAAAIRAFYFSLARARIRDRRTASTLDLDRTLERTIDTDSYVLTHDIDRNLFLALALAQSNIETMTSTLAQVLVLDLNSVLGHLIDGLLFSRDLKKLKQELQQLKDELSFFSYNKQQNLRQWQQENAPRWILWTKRLEAVISEHQNLCMWTFSSNQKRLLGRYYNANKLLIDCLNSDCYVSRGVREKIEEELLLPIAEIKKRQQ